MSEIGKWVGKSIATLVAMLFVVLTIIASTLFAISSFQQIETLDSRLKNIEHQRQQEKEQETFDFLTSLME